MRHNTGLYTNPESESGHPRLAMRCLSFRAGAVLLGIIFGLVTMEIGLRIHSRRAIAEDPFWAGTVLIHERADDPTLVYRLAPGTETTRDDAHYVINSDGFRDDEFSRPPPAEAARIVVLGDSVAFGWGVALEEAFPQRLESILNSPSGRIHEQTETIVYNLSVDGYSTHQEVRLLETVGLSLDPDLVILSYVLNDPHIFDGGLSRYYNSSRIEILRLLSDAAFKVRQKFGSAQLRPGAWEYHRYIHERYAEDIEADFKKLGALARENDLRLIVLITPILLWPRDDEYPLLEIHRQIKNLSLDQGFEVIDLEPEFETTVFEEIAFDVWHPRPAGHEIIAQTLASRLRAEFQ